MHAQACQELRQLKDQLTNTVSQHLRANQGFEAAASHLGALPGLGAFAVIILGLWASSHVHFALLLATAVLGASLFCPMSAIMQVEQCRMMLSCMIQKG